MLSSRMLCAAVRLRPVLRTPVTKSRCADCPRHVDMYLQTSWVPSGILTRHPHWLPTGVRSFRRMRQMPIEARVRKKDKISPEFVLVYAAPFPEFEQLKIMAIILSTVSGIMYTLIYFGVITHKAEKMKIDWQAKEDVYALCVGFTLTTFMFLIMGVYYWKKIARMYVHPPSRSVVAFRAMPVLRRMEFQPKDIRWHDGANLFRGNMSVHGSRVTVDDTNALNGELYDRYIRNHTTAKV